MSEHLVGWLIGGVIVLVIAAVGVYYLLRFLRGTIRLTLPQTSFSPGETIRGRMELETKKPIEGKRLLVRLIGTRVTRYRSGKNQRTRSEEIYRDEVVIEPERSYHAGEKLERDFEIHIPDASQSDGAGAALGKALATGLELISGARTRTRWKVEARLEAKGVDLAKSKRVFLKTLPV